MRDKAKRLARYHIYGSVRITPWKGAQIEEIVSLRFLVFAGERRALITFLSDFATDHGWTTISVPGTRRGIRAVTKSESYYEIFFFVMDV